MDIFSIMIIAGVVTVIVLQAFFPGRQISIVVTGAALVSFFAVATGKTEWNRLLANISWDTLIILICLGVFSNLIAATNIFGIIAAKATRLTGGRLTLTYLFFALVMYLVSAFVNNITAVVLMIPIFLTVLNTLGVSNHCLTIFSALILTATNLGGAASPIGDFPAILLLSDTSVGMSFSDYLALAAPICSLMVAAVICAYLLLLRRAKKAPDSPLSRKMALSASAFLHRNIRVKRSVCSAGGAIFLLMMILWVFPPEKWKLSPALVSGGGVALFILVSTVMLPSRKNDVASLPETEARVRGELDAASPVIFLASLFFMVAAAESTGVLLLISDELMKLSASPLLCVSALMVLTGVSTGVFSAGPAMSAMLPVAKNMMTVVENPQVLFIGLALSVCAGSSLVLTAATSGPLMQTLVGKAGITTVEGKAPQFGFRSYLPFGILSYVIIQTMALGWVYVQLQGR